MDMKDLLNKLDSIGSDIANESVNEGQYDGKSREELLKMKAQAEADIKNMQSSGNSPQAQFYDETQMMMAQQHLDFINDALKKLGEDAEVVEAVGDGAEPFYELQDEFCGGECSSNAHRAFIDEIARYLTSDQIADFVDHFRRHYDMQKESVEETANTPELDSYIQEMDSDDQVQEDCACEDTVEETVEVAVDDLRSLIALAGLQPQATTEATVELDEYANSPDEDYQDTDVQLNKMSVGLNGPKGQHKKEYPGDNPLAAELADKLKAMLEK
jgi:hypothetical protein